MCLPPVRRAGAAAGLPDLRYRRLGWVEPSSDHPNNCVSCNVLQRLEVASEKISFCAGEPMQAHAMALGKQAGPNLMSSSAVQGPAAHLASGRNHAVHHRATVLLNACLTKAGLCLTALLHPPSLPPPSLRQQLPLRVYWRVGQEAAAGGRAAHLPALPSSLGGRHGAGWGGGRRRRGIHQLGGCGRGAGAHSGAAVWWVGWAWGCALCVGVRCAWLGWMAGRWHGRANMAGVAIWRMINCSGLELTHPTNAAARSHPALAYPLPGDNAIWIHANQGDISRSMAASMWRNMGH